MAEQIVKIEGVVPVSSPAPLNAAQSGTWNVGITGQPISQYVVQNPAIDGVYLFSVAAVAGVTTANNFISLVNPPGSGKTVSLAGIFFSSTSAAATQVTDPMRGYRATAVSGGTLQADAVSCKFSTSQPDPVAEVRIGNPAATLGAAFFNSPPVVTTGVGGSGVHEVEAPPGAGPFILSEGEGVVIRTETGDTDQRWNITVAWAEL